MAWGMLDDKFHRNPKVRALRRDGAKGREALGVWLYWWSWCLDDPAQNGIVPRDEMPAGDMKSAALLEARGMWEPLPEGWHVHDFEDYLPGGRAIRDEKREAKRLADRVRVATNRAESRSSVADVARDKGDDSRAGVAVPSQHVAASRAPACTGIPSPAPPVPNPSAQSAFGDIAEGGENPAPIAWPKGWHPQRLALVLDECIREATGGAFAFSQRAYTPLSDALDLFVQANPDDPAEPCRFAFRAFAKDDYARKAKCSVALFLAEPGKYLGAPTP